MILLESFVQDLRYLIKSKGNIVDFMFLLKKHPEARDILRDQGYEFDFLEFMADEDIFHQFQPFSNCLAEDVENGIMLDILIYALKEDDTISGNSETFVNGFANLFYFKTGIPVVCNLMIGNAYEYWEVDAIESKNTGDYSFDFALNRYDAFIECGFDCDETIDEIKIQLPFNDWDYEDIKALYVYISKHFRYENRKATYSFDDDNEFSGVNIQLVNSLYEIDIENYSYEGHDYLKIRIVRKRDDFKIYQAINTLLTSDETDDFVMSTLKTIIQQKTYKYRLAVKDSPSQTATVPPAIPS